MLDKTNISTWMSFNTSCISTGSVVTELQYPVRFLWSLWWMSKYRMDYVKAHRYHWFNVRENQYEYPDIFQCILCIDWWCSSLVAAHHHIPAEYTSDVQNIEWIMLKPTDTIDYMLDKINMSTQVSFNASCASTDGTAAALQHSAGFLRSIPGYPKYWIDYVKTHWYHVVNVG